MKNVVVNPVALWMTSIGMRKKGLMRSAKIVKAANYAIFKSILPPEAEVGKNLTLGHYGLGVVVHPNVILGDNVHLWHGVTLAVAAPVGSSTRMIIEDNVTIGANTVVVTREGRNLTIGANSVVGAGSVVLGDVPPGVVVAGNPAVVRHRIGEGNATTFR